MAKTFGLIIQGPLVSIGRTGGQTHVLKSDLEKQGGFVHYDCRDNINRIIQDFGDLFQTIVISTWESELQSNDVWTKATVIASPDPGDIKRHGYTTRSRNKHRQFISLKAGLGEMEKAAPDLVIKIRTDQYLDLRGLIDSYLQQLDIASDPDNLIGVPLVRSDNYLTHDLYFIATRNTLNKFCDALLAFNRYEFSWCVHRDMLLKHAYINYRQVIGVPDWAYFPIWPPLGASRETKKIFSFMYKNIFVPLGPAVYKTVVARGSLQSNEHIEEYIYPKVAEASELKNILNMPGFISTNWKSYFNWLQETTGEKISWANYLTIQAGSFGWLIFQKIRKLAAKINITQWLKRIYRKLFISSATTKTF